MLKHKKDDMSERKREIDSDRGEGEGERERCLVIEKYMFRKRRTQNVEGKKHTPKVNHLYLNTFEKSLKLKSKIELNPQNNFFDCTAHKAFST